MSLQGAFRAALETLHRARLEALGVPKARADAMMADNWHQYGKPEVVQFRHAASALDAQAAAMGKRISEVYMVIPERPQYQRSCHVFGKAFNEMERPPPSYWPH